MDFFPPLFSRSLSPLCLFIVLGVAMQMAKTLLEFQSHVKGQGAAPDMSGWLAVGSLWGFRYTSASNLLKSFCSFLYPQSTSPLQARTWLSVPHSFCYFSHWGVEADRACKTQENQSRPISLSCCPLSLMADAILKPWDSQSSRPGYLPFTLPLVHFQMR